MTYSGQPGKTERDFTGGGKYGAPEPYPETKVVEPNLYYARILLEDYAGKVSEISAVTQYMYHNFVVDKPELRELLEGIGIVEMHHMELLGRTIKALGGDPRFRGYDGRYWSGELIYYGTDVVDRITADIASEKQAIQQYRYHQTLITDRHIQKLLERIIKDEMYHITLLQSALKKYQTK